MKVVALGRVGLHETAGHDGEVKSLAGYAEDVVKVEGGEEHCLVLLSQGQVIVWGRSDHGRLGLEGQLPAVVDRPMLLDIEGVEDIACGGKHALALLSNGTVLAWGCNNNGQLGLGSLHSQHRPKQIPALPLIKAIASGASHSVFLSEKGHVFVCGRGLEGQLGCGAQVKYHTCPHIVKSLSCYEVSGVAAASNVSLFMMANGSVWSTGDNTSGELGLGDKKQRNLPEQMPSPTQTVHSTKVVHDAAVPRYGTAESYTYSKLHRPLPPVEHTAAFVKPSVGWGHVCLLDASGRVFSCGSNATGQCGQGLTRTGAFRDLQEVKVEAPLDSGCAATTARTFRINDTVSFEGRRGHVIGLSRGRVGIRLDLPDATRDVGALPSEVTLLQRASEDPPNDERVFVDDVVAGTSFSAALSGGLLYVWGRLSLSNSKVEGGEAGKGEKKEKGEDEAEIVQPTLPDGRKVRYHAPLTLGGPRPALVPSSFFSETDCNVVVKSVFCVQHGLLAVVECEEGKVEGGGGGEENLPEGCTEEPAAGSVRSSDDDVV